MRQPEQEWALTAAATHRTTYEGHFNDTHNYLSYNFKCFAHLFPLNISSSLNIHLTSSLNFLPVSLQLLCFCPPFRLGNH